MTATPHHCIECLERERAEHILLAYPDHDYMYIRIADGRTVCLELFPRVLGKNLNRTPPSHVLPLREAKTPAGLWERVRTRTASPVGEPVSEV